MVSVIHGMYDHERNYVRINFSTNVPYFKYGDLKRNPNPLI